MIGFGRRRRPLEPVDHWLNSAGADTHRKIGAVHAQLVCEDESTVIAGLQRAGVTGPPDASQELARRISATPRSTLLPEGSEFVDAKGRTHRIADTRSAGTREGLEMSEVDSKAAVRRFFEEGWNKGDLAEVKAFIADEFVSHNSLDYSIQSADDYFRGVVAYREAFPDLVTSVEDVVAEGDRVVARGTDRGTHRGSFMGRAPTGRSVTVTWIEIFRMESGKAVEGWLESDTYKLMDQLGS
jgi:predicted ester cyclase